ncbi:MULTISPECIES: hypothetical protein [unclassified Xanthomonas]|uniref:hypothetical protein n=1 Tax=Xanthomonas sp. LMG 9002 TaxID=1591158 RepID=UPI001367DD0D|nr:hypothetical protein [Xanthomonas sp. LMG 9002]
MSDYHVKLVNVRFKKIKESGEATADQVRNNSWVVNAGLPVEVQRGIRDFEFEEGFDGELIGDEDFVVEASELDGRWIEGFDMAVGSELMKCVFSDSFTGVLVFEALFIGRGRKSISLPKRFLVFQAGNSGALYSCPDVNSAWAAAAKLINGQALSSEVKGLSLSLPRRRGPHP